MTKPEVRELARKCNLVIAEKPDSQEICFVPGGDYKKFLDAYLSEQGDAARLDLGGEMVTSDGKVIGEHAGVHNFTVGQRKGLGVATGSPLYVIQIENDTRRVVVGKDEDLYSQTLRANRVNLISQPDITEPMRVLVKIRHKHSGAPAMIEAAGPAEVLVTFDEPQRAITPGQAAVFYDWRCGRRRRLDRVAPAPFISPKVQAAGQPWGGPVLSALVWRGGPGWPESSSLPHSSPDFRAGPGTFVGWTLPAHGATVSVRRDPVFTPQGRFRRGERIMRIWHLCYAALGIAVARWVFKRQSITADPVHRLRSSGLL